ncbi:hypothetical protein [Thermoactinomyces sp. DSM 45892]|uniref:hypothetical protein n=1 Tax=Thermoactinomyces sp. DSM 45892 TaxID=1882753 RepID=UPI00089CF0DE|nr:hypothetical protein [Thermoactinomyces sp. DSM 45892]SDY87309.1 hypothetical protein SAMN05444416_109133 [Thermoactinomyces sp. DSM 45892]
MKEEQETIAGLWLRVGILGAIALLGGFCWFITSTDMPMDQIWNLLAEKSIYYGKLSLAILVIGSISVWTILSVGRLILHMRYRKKASVDVRYIRILPSIEKMETSKVVTFVKAFAGMTRHLEERWKKGKPWYRFRFVMPENSNEIAIYLGYPQDKHNGVYDTIRSVYPQAEIHTISHQEFPQPTKQGEGGHFFLPNSRKRQGLPLSSITEKKESQLGMILGSMRSNTIVDLQFSPTDWEKLEKRSEDVLHDLRDKKISELSPEEKAKKTNLSKRLTGREDTLFVKISLWSDHKYARSVIRSIANSIQATLRHDGKISFWRWRNKFYRHPLIDRNPIPHRIPKTIMTLTHEELANLLHIPSGDSEIYKKPASSGDNERGYIPHLQIGHRTLKDNELAVGAFIGEQIHPIKHRNIKIDFEQLTKHFLLTGSPGMGKSSLLIEMIDGMIREWVEDPNHPGITVIDPSEETVAVVQNRLAYMEKKLGLKIPRDRIRSFDLTNQSRTYPALNILHVPRGVDFQTAADDAADVILHSLGSGDSLTEAKRILKNTIQALIMDSKKHSILAIPEFLRSPKFRSDVLKRIKGKDSYVYREILAWGDEEIENEAILNRIDPLLRNTSMRRMFGQKEWTFDIRRYMDEGCFTFINTLGMSTEGMRVVVGNLVNQYHQTAKSRPKGSKYHFMLVDESHLVQIPIMAKIIAEDRKFGFGIGLITQMVDQITNKELLTALNLIGTIITCAQSGTGASKIEKMTEGHFKATDISRLPERHAAVFTRTKVEGESQIISCVVRNRPPTVYLPSGKEADYRNHEKGIAERYGLRWAKGFMESSGEVQSRETIDKLIQEYFDEIDRIVSEPGPEEKGNKPTKAVPL